MFDHVTIRVSDRGAAERFYDQVLRALELVKGHSGEQFAQWGDFSVAVPFTAPAGAPATVRAFESSAENGQPINVYDVPVQLG